MKFVKFLLLVIISVICFLIIRGIFSTDSDGTKNQYIFSGEDERDNDMILNEPHHLDESTEHLMWFIQVSDLHISAFHDKTRIESFERFCDEILKIIKPRVVIASGDLTDGKKINLADSDQIIFEWETYERIVKKSSLGNNTVWLDIRGNHDNFNVPSPNNPANFFRKFGMKKKFSRSYIHQVSQPSGDKYTFIGVDACTEPGPKRPYNFFGNLEKYDLELLKQYADMSKNSNGTIWFGHFPTSTIHSSDKFRSLMINGAAYLCGHLHNLIGIMPTMYARYPNGMLELELADWKVNRVFRILAFDSGLFSFRDVYVNKNDQKNTIFTLITNPKNILAKVRHEPLNRIKKSSHIRFLLFSEHEIISTEVYLDDEFIGNAKQIKNKKIPLYTIDWKPENFEVGIHKIYVRVQDEYGNIDITYHEFALDKTMKSFNFFSTLLLVNDAIYFVRSLFYIFTFLMIGFLLIFRSIRRYPGIRLNCSFVQRIVLNYFRRFVLLCSIDIVFWYFILSTIYLAVGPWFIGEFLVGHYGICFVWGIYINDKFMKEDIQYLIGFWHVLLFQIPLVIHLSYRVESSFMNLTNPSLPIKKYKNIPSRLIGFIWENCSYIFLSVLSIMQIYEYYHAYSLTAAVICPKKTWNFLFTIYLRSMCGKLKENDFNRVLSRGRVN